MRHDRRRKGDRHAKRRKSAKIERGRRIELTSTRTGKKWERTK
jgi:hypothetical protein